MIITIENDGPLIAASNFWDSDQGKYYLSTNAGWFRLLLPRSLEFALADMATARVVVVSRGPWPAEKLADAIEILFDDGTDNPFALHTQIETLDRVPPDDDASKEWSFSVWTQPRRGKPHQALGRTAYYRRVPEIPWLKPH